MSTTTKSEEMQPVEIQPVDMKSVKMLSVEVKSEEMQPQPKPEMQFKPEMQPEIQLPVSDVKPKRFALKPSKRSALKPSKRSALKPLRQKRPASDTMVLELKRCKSEPSKSITLEDLPVMIQINGQKYVKLMKHQDQVVVNLREYIYLLESYILRRRELFSHSKIGSH